MSEKTELQLAAPSLEYRDSYLIGLKKLQKEGWQLDQDYDEIEKNFGAFVERLSDEEKGINMRPGRVPQTTRWLIVDGKFAGRLAVRHQLNDALRRSGGHIGYDIVPEFRLRGYGSALLSEGLKIAKSLDIGPVLLTVNENNLGSQKIIKKHGGVLEDVIDMGKNEPRKMRFWIKND